MSINLSDYASISDACADLPSGGVIIADAGNYALSADSITQDNITIIGDGSNLTTFTYATLGFHAVALDVQADNFMIKGVKFIGPSSSYLENETAIQFVGTNTTTRRKGLVVKECAFTGFGCYCVFAQFASNIRIRENVVQDSGYAGFVFLSCDSGWIDDNQIDNLYPGPSSNSYGVLMTHDSVGYNTDPNKETKQATNPFTYNFFVRGNEISRIAWEAIDCHGGYGIHIIDNRIFATAHGIACSTSSGDAGGYCGSDNFVIRNLVDARNKDGTDSGYEGLHEGILIDGSVIMDHARVICYDNNVLFHDPSGILSAHQLNSQIGVNIITSTAAYVAATGGTVTTSGNFKIHKFTSSGSFVVSSAGNTLGSNTIEVLTVAGGGGGGSSTTGGARTAGGGAGGGVLYSATHGVTAGTYTVTVGAGGAADTAGANSVFDDLTAIGGGRGRSEYFTGTGSQNGGSGGGGAGFSGSTNTGGSATAGQGNTGGTGSTTASHYGAGGGGGATGVGGNGSGTNGGTGGTGFTSSISGTSTVYGAGGGGGSFDGGTPGAAGGATATAGVSGGTAGTATANSGSGGGGGGATSSTAGTGGHGADGVVYVKYKFQ